MSARVWTIDELDRVHPLPGDWEWMRNGATVGGVPMWSAVILDHDYDEPEVSSIICVDREGRLHCELGSDDTRTADVALAVILTSKGLDSYDAMAAAMERRAVDAQARASVGGGFSDCIHAARADGQQREAVHAAAMLRSGTVQP